MLLSSARGFEGEELVRGNENCGNRLDSSVQSEPTSNDALVIRTTSESEPPQVCPVAGGRVAGLRYALILALLVAAVTDLSFLWLFWPHGFASDFAVFWQAPRNAAPYRFSETPFASPPTALLFFQALKLLPFWWAYALWNAAGLALFFALGARLYGRRAALLGVVSPPAALALAAGQLSLLVGALTFAAFLSGPTLCGVLLGIALCLKPQMVVMAPALLLFAREYRALAALFVTLALIAALSSVLFGVSVWTDWYAGMDNLLVVAEARGALNLTVSPMAYSPWLELVSLPMSLWGLYVCRNFPAAYRAAAAVAASLFAAPYSLFYDLAPLAVFAAVSFLRSSSWKSFAAVLTYAGGVGLVSIPALWPSLEDVQ